MDEYRARPLVTHPDGPKIAVDGCLVPDKCSHCGSTGVPLTHYWDSNMYGYQDEFHRDFIRWTICDAQPCIDWWNRK